MTTYQTIKEIAKTKALYLAVIAGLSLGTYSAGKAVNYLESLLPTSQAPIAGLALPEGERVYQVKQGRDVKKLVFNANGNLEKVVSAEDGKMQER